MSAYDYASLEHALRQALALARKSLPPAQAQLVFEFLDAAEYGLALETLAGSLVEANTPVSAALCAFMRDAARQMGYRDDLSDIREPEVAAALSRIWESCQKPAE